MFDDRLRRRLAPAVGRGAALLDVAAITPNRLSAAGLLAGLLAAAAAAAGWWSAALLGWLLCRVLDGLDGPLARRRAAPGPPSAAGALIDLVADFAVYAALPIGVAVGLAGAQAEANGEPAGPSTWLPFMVVLGAYCLNAVALLTFSAQAERIGARRDDGRSPSLPTSAAEGVETIAVYGLWLLLPEHAPAIAWAWAGLVLLSAAQRTWTGHRLLRAASEAAVRKRT
ncbi:MAG: CDP-alcohol phosphatidyltransferase family protein [Sporichthyaceae bacterium]